MRGGLFLLFEGGKGVSRGVLRVVAMAKGSRGGGRLGGWRRW